MILIRILVIDGEQHSNLYIYSFAKLSRVGIKMPINDKMSSFLEILECDSTVVVSLSTLVGNV